MFILWIAVAVLNAYSVYANYVNKVYFWVVLNGAMLLWSLFNLYQIVFTH